MVNVGQKITYLLRHRDQDIKNYETFLKFLKPQLKHLMGNSIFLKKLTFKIPISIKDLGFII